MGIAAKKMGAGFAAAQARFSEWGAVRTAISAAGTTQATATALTGDVNLVGTATALQGVQLPNVEIQDSAIVFNDATGVTIVVYPPTSGTINQLAANSGVQVANNTCALFLKVTATRWIVFLSA